METKDEKEMLGDFFEQFYGYEYPKQFKRNDFYLMDKYFRIFRSGLYQYAVQEEIENFSPLMHYGNYTEVLQEIFQFQDNEFKIEILLPNYPKEIVILLCLIKLKYVNK